MKGLLYDFYKRISTQFYKREGTKPHFLPCDSTRVGHRCRHATYMLESASDLASQCVIVKNMDLNLW